MRLNYERKELIKLRLCKVKRGRDWVWVWLGKKRGHFFLRYEGEGRVILKHLEGNSEHFKLDFFSLLSKT